MQLAHDAGLPSPKRDACTEAGGRLGTGFIMVRVEGETIARKILRDESSQRRGRCWRVSSARSRPASTVCRRQNCQNFAQ